MHLNNEADQENLFDKKSIAAIISSTNASSLIATFLVVFAYMRDRHLKNDSEFIYILCICGSDFIWSFIMLFDSVYFFTGYKFPSLLCTIEGFLKVYFGLTEFFTIIAFCFIIKEYIINNINLRNQYSLYIFFSYFSPLILSVMYLIHKK